MSGDGEESEETVAAIDPLKGLWIISTGRKPSTYGGRVCTDPSK